MSEARAFHFEGMAEDGDPVPRPGGVNTHREVMKDLDADQDLLAHVPINTNRFPEPVRQG